MADINVLGHKVKPWEAAVVIIGGVAVTWFAIRQRQSSQASSTAASSSNPSAIDPLTGLPTSEDNTVDPLTGETYLAEAQQYGSVQAAEQALAGTGLGSGYYGTGSPYGYPYDTTTNTGTTTVSGTAYATNAAWAQAVEAGLTDIGYAPQDVAAALGRYLGNLPETAAQATIIQAAIAEYGPPPVGTFQIIQKPPTGPHGTGTTKVTVPDVEGQPQEAAFALISQEGLKPKGSKDIKGKVLYVVSQDPKAGTKVDKDSTVTVTSKEKKLWQA